MIKKIAKIKGYGIFEDFSYNANLLEFNRYNLFYGWNGSCKSTISNLFSELTLENKALLHPDSEWKIIAENGEISSQNLETNKLNVYVFNKSFVKKNVFTDDHIKGIVYLSEKMKDEKERLTEREKHLSELENTWKQYDYKLNGDKSSKKNKGLKDNNAAFLSEAAKRVKASFQVIEVDDKRLLNYDKTKFLAFVEKHKDIILRKSNCLSVSELETLRKSIRSQEKEQISISDLRIYTIEYLTDIFEKVIALCNTSVTNQTITRLKENPAKANWVYEGLKMFHTQNSKSCEFCGQPLPLNFISDLNNHFSEEFQKLRDDLINMISWIKSQKLDLHFPLASDLFDEFAKPYQTSYLNYSKSENHVNDFFDFCIVALCKKLDNPFELYANKDLLSIDISIYEVYNKSYELLLGYISQHNKKLNNLQNEIENAKFKLELHYVTEEVTNYGYLPKKEEEYKLEKEIKTCISSIEEKKNEISYLKILLSDETIPAEKFNEMLHKFLGREDLSLKARQEGGYEIIRYQSGEAKNLSEGEESAIGLVYFITKLRENDNKIENTIVVFDDPISSFDSNHLFLAKSFIKKYCEQCKQLFILTHNFSFFKVVRDWFVHKTEDIVGLDGKKVKNSSGKVRKQPLWRIYKFKVSTIANRRVSTFENAKDELIKYNSEYHYLFSKLLEYNHKSDLSIDDCYSFSNIIRRICEAALTFKYPQYNKIRDLIYITSIESESKDRIYDFLNKYSHLDRIETHENLIESRIEEGKSVITDVLRMLETELPKHYKNMCDAIHTY